LQTVLHEKRTRYKSGRWGPYRQASPHRPGTAPALGLRAVGAAPIVEQTIPSKEIPMWLRSLLRSPKARPSVASVRRSPRRPAACRLGIETLEDRTVPSTFTVLNVADSGDGSLRAAILGAEASPAADVTAFARQIHGTIMLTTGELDIRGDLTINGPGANRLTVSGNDASRVFDVVGGADAGGGITVAITGLTVAHGRADVGGGIRNSGF